jgi:hypothetical protein
MSGVRYYVNGREVSRQEYLDDCESLNKTLATSEGRQGLVRSMYRDPAYYESHESMAAGMPSHMAKEHAEWVQQQGLVGVEVMPSGNVKFAGQRNKDEYLARRGLADATSAGSGTKTPRRKAAKKVTP